MGSGIAAHFANLGFTVSLLDRTIEHSVQGFDRAKMVKPPHFYLAERAMQVQLGGLESHLEFVGQADWVVEAVAEKTEIKRAVYEQIEPALRSDAYVSTNTSGLEISSLIEGRSDAFRRRFLGTHFFNPPRYLKLLELIPTSETDPTVVENLTEFFERYSARRIVLAKDTPGFIANRYGMWCMYLATHVAERLRLTLEQTDTITGPFLGRPKTGTFRLNDLVGLDVMEDIAGNLIRRCTEDAHVGVLKTPASIQFLIEKGFLGEKAGQGFYRRDGKDLLAFDLLTHAYRPRMEAELPSVREFGGQPLGLRLRNSLMAKDETGEYLRMFLLPALRYANELKEEIAFSIVDFDRVMQWGFGWELGPFGLIDAISADSVGIKAAPFYVDASYRTFEGDMSPIPDPIEYRCLDQYTVLESHKTFQVRDLGDDVRAVVMTTKHGVISNELVQELSRWLVSEAGGPFVLTSDQRMFSVGFDIKFLWSAIQSQEWAEIDNSLRDLQSLGELLEEKRAVAAVFGHTLGAGFELARSCAAVVAQADANIGLPETKVGLIPAGRGCALMRLASQESPIRVAEMCVRITEGTVSRNADHARALGFLRASDVTSYHPDRLLWDAKQTAMKIEPRPRPEWEEVVGPVVGRIDQLQKDRLSKGEMTAYDEFLGDRLKAVIAKSNSYEQALHAERAEFLEICNKALSQARLRHMIEQKTPLRN
jgi:3-hydroxyacyl-CoA dehydrogenase